MPIDAGQFHDSFFDEVAEHLERMEQLMLLVERGSASAEDVNALFRAAHSIKGASGTFGFTEMAELTHFLESLLQRARDGSLSISQNVADAVLTTLDVLRMQLDAYRSKRPLDPQPASQAKKAMELLLDTAGDHQRVGAPSDLSRLHIRFRTDRNPSERESAFDAVLSYLRELGTCSVDERTESLTFIFEGFASGESIADVFEFVKLPDDVLSIEPIGEQAAAASPPVEAAFGFFDEAAPPKEHDTRAVSESPRGPEDATIRVKLAKIDTLVNLVGEMLIAQTALQARSERLDPVQHADLHASIERLQRHTREVRESVMAVRMLPLDSVFGRFPRMVRDLSAQLGKDVDFVVEGGDTELDKGLLERIVDPITHIIRNSVDHGIEPASTRIAAGKPVRGRISVRSFQRGGNVHVEVQDDGAGMNREHILAKAIERGLPVDEHMTDQEVWALTCLAGFSTASEVTDVSGRGVGMDVVKRNIQELNGSVTIDSVQGRGTCITLIVPLTLAILDGLTVACGDETYVLPLSSISESLVLHREDVIAPPGTDPFIVYRGEPLPLCAAPGTPLNIREGMASVAVVVESDNRKAGLVVDALGNEHQVVIKSLGSNFRKVDGFCGATIMGDGRVALILDVSALFRSLTPR